ncbi:hypothetical protein P4H65_24250 [Paenibacillus chitinolyticus]|uniref:hypothetical protein n=1 Tax=Paenibacillus chitinolyticus TaxID=79263 RepID=UPI002DB7DAB6|nr:hypothetical protein [Paenibacillus chitinolyticus]MEC0248907.1 hypothetical protein [Paenibacillus chitinolyticus]
MRKSVIAVLLLAAAIYVAAFYKLFDREPMPAPPMAFVEKTFIEVPVRIASYSWGLGKEGFGSPWDVVKDEEAVPVPKQSVLTFSFEKEPESAPQIRQVISNEEHKVLETKLPYEIIVPETAGIYVYSISASWKDGSAQYAVKVRVKNSL